MSSEQEAEVAAAGRRRALPGPRWKRMILEIWALSYAVTLFFGILQYALMWDAWWAIAPMVLVPPILFLAMRAFARAHLRGRVVASVALALIAAVHLLVPIFQLVGVSSPSVDSVIAAVVAAALFLAL